MTKNQGYHRKPRHIRPDQVQQGLHVELAGPPGSGDGDGGEDQERVAGPGQAQVLAGAQHPLFPAVADHEGVSPSHPEGRMPSRLFAAANATHQSVCDDVLVRGI